MLPRTLFGRLLLVFFGFGAVMTAALLVVMQGTHRHYHLEADQTANRELARIYVSANFFMAESPLSGATLHRGLANVSAANPEADFYLLDGAGRLVAASVPEAMWQRRTITLGPLDRFLAGDALPILAEDPRDSGRRDIFSAARVAIRDCPAKYLYVVLSRGAHTPGASQLRTRYELGEDVGFMLLAAGLAIGLSVVVLRLLTRRLSVLEQAMLHLQGTDTAAVGPRAAGMPVRSGDEVDRLATLFEACALRIQGQMRALESTDLFRREMLANVSHDLRTPLTTLQTHLEILATADSALSSAEREEYLGVALRQTGRVIALVEQLLEVAKLDAKQVALQVEPFRMDELLHDIAQKFALAAKQRNVSLVTDAPSGAAWAAADIALIERVLDNLIDNALQHSPAGSRVSLTSAAVGDRVRVMVSDSGPGLSAEDRARAFDRFYRRDPARAASSGHAGLGLAIVKGILDLHHAEIHVDSAPGAGATFWFELPSQAAVPATPRA